MISELMFYDKGAALSASAYVRAETTAARSLDTPAAKGYPVDNGGEKWG